MQFIDIAERFGIPIVLAGALLWYVQRLVTLLVTEMQTELRENFTRLEAIIVKLISNSKNNELKQEKLIGKVDTLENVFTKLIRKDKDDRRN